jgi:hypothetical protein
VKGMNFKRVAVALVVVAVVGALAIFGIVTGSLVGLLLAMAAAGAGSYIAL